MEKANEKTLKTAFVVLISVVSLCVTASAAPTYSFVNITNNNAGDAAIGEAQLSVELFDLGTGTQFVFSNSGPEASSIADIYFDDGTTAIFNAPMLLGNIDNTDPGVSFAPFATPPVLPGGNAVSFSVTAGLSADSDAPVQPNGVNPGETVGITLSYLGGVDFDDVVNEFASGDLRVGIHVQGFDTGGSESFVNNGTTTVVPTPGSLLLSMVGFGCVKLWNKRKAIPSD